MGVHVRGRAGVAGVAELCWQARGALGPDKHGAAARVASLLMGRLLHAGAATEQPAYSAKGRERPLLLSVVRAQAAGVGRLHDIGSVSGVTLVGLSTVGKHAPCSAARKTVTVITLNLRIRLNLPHACLSSQSSAPCASSNPL